MFPSSLPKIFQNTHPFPFPQRICCTELLLLGLVCQYEDTKKDEKLWSSLLQINGCFDRGDRKKSSRSGIGTTLMIHSDRRCGRCWKNSISCQEGYRGSCVLSQISVQVRYRNIKRRD